MRIKLSIICPYCGKIGYYENFQVSYTNELSFDSRCNECHKIIMEFKFEK